MAKDNSSVPIPIFTIGQLIRFHSSVDKRGPSECWPWKGPFHQDGYGVFRFGSRRDSKQLLAHRIVFALNSTIITSLCVCHHCDNRKCCNPIHLFQGTRRDNNIDRNQKGRDGNHKGTANGRAKLTEDGVRLLRAAKAAGDTIAPIARKLGISKESAYDILKGRHWKHVL